MTITNTTDRERALSAEVQQLKEELLEQARVVGMSTDREYALAGKIARQEKVLKLALEALEVYWGKAEHRRTREDERKVEDAIDAIREALGETK